MGFSRLSEVHAWKDESEELEQFEQAVLIGPEPPMTHPTFTRTYLDEDGIVKYGDEMEGISVWKHFPIRLQLDDKTLGPKSVVTLFTITLEDMARAFAQKTAVLAFTPATFDWFGAARFKTVNRIGASERNALIKKAFQHTIQKAMHRGALKEISVERILWEALSGLPQDMFGNQHCCYSRLYGYEQSDTWYMTVPDSDEDPANQYQYSSPNRRRNPMLLYGMCDDFNACCQAIEGSECMTSVFEDIDRTGVPRVRDHRNDWIPTTASTRDLAPHFRRTSAIKALAGCTAKQRAALLKGEFGNQVERNGEVAVHALHIFHSMLRSHHRRTVKREEAVTRTDLKE